MSSLVRNLHVDLHIRTFERMEAIKSRTCAASHAEVLRNALRIYESWLNVHDRLLAESRPDSGQAIVGGVLVPSTAA